MDSSRRLLDRCSLVLCFTGANLFARTNCSIIIRWILRVWFLSALIPIAYDWFQIAKMGKHGEMMTLPVFLIAAITAIGLLVLKSKHLELFLECMVNDISQSDQKIMLQNLNYIHLLCVLMISFLAVTHVYQLIPFAGKTSLRIIYRIYKVACICTTYWGFSSCVFYWIALRIMSFYHKHQMKLITHVASQESCNHRIIGPIIKSIRNSLIAFEHNLSFLPFLWFMYGMISSAAYVYSLMRGAGNAVEVLFALLDYLPPLIVVVAVSRAMEQLSVLVEEAISFVASNESIKSSQQFLILRELDSLKAMRLTGMSYFTLDRSFVVSYIGSVLTFAALMAGFTTK